MGETASLLEFGTRVRYADMGREVVERIRHAILDTMGTMVAGRRGESVPELSALASSWGGSPEATLITSGRRLPLPLAALVNATAARAWDLDDVHDQNTCHVSASVVPATLAAAQCRGPVSGSDLLVAVAVGTELICRMSAAPRIPFGETGSSMTNQCPHYGVALAVSRLLKLGLEKTGHALGIAHARAGGNQQGLLAGASTVRLMQGISAEGGVISALMAERGLTGSSDVLEGRFGYYQVFHRGRYEPKDLVSGLGERWLVNEVSIKNLYPCCKFIHGPVEALMTTLQETGAPLRDIESIKVTVSNQDVFDLICTPKQRKWKPATVADAQFSLPFMLARAAVHGGLGFECLDPSGFGEPSVADLMERIEVDVQPTGDPGARGRFPMPGDVTTRLRGGHSERRIVEYPKGHFRNPMSFDDVATKFLACARFGGLAEGRAREVVGLVRDLEKLDDVGALMPLLVPEQPS